MKPVHTRIMIARRLTRALAETREFALELADHDRLDPAELQRLADEFQVMADLAKELPTQPALRVVGG
jgi:hypothetical protein